MGVGGSRWEWVGVGGSGWEWMGVDGSRWEWMGVDGSGWEWVEVQIGKARFEELEIVFTLSEAAIRGILWKKVFLKVLQNF